LPEHQIAAIGIAAGYLTILSYFEVGVVRVLLRDYPKIADDPETRDRVFSALFIAWLFQSIFILIIAGVLLVTVLTNLAVPTLRLLFFAMAIDLLVLSWREWLKVVFFAAFRQRIATIIGFFLTLLRLCTYVALLIWPSLHTYAYILIGMAIFAFIVWASVFIKIFHFRPKFDQETPHIILQALSSYGIWEHLNRMTVVTLFQIDTVVLSWFAAQRLDEIGNYTIALTFGSMFFIVPRQLHVSLQVVLSNYDDDPKRHAAINSFFKLNLVISIAQLVFVFLVGKWIVQFLFGKDVDPTVVEYVYILIIGITVMNLSWPYRSVINALGNLRQAFLTAFLPILLLGLLIYILAAANWGALGVAYANIAVYTCLAFAVTKFARTQFAFPLRLRLLTGDERKLLNELIGRKSV
jgi:O-antigen/teichoic acid export membrane protein